MTSSQIQPEKIYALVVGIETYQEAPNLSAPANDAIKFYNWLLNRKVLPENIFLFVSPLDVNRNILPKTRKVPSANRENISSAINNLLSQDICGELLYIFWGGHGFITELPETRRRLYYADTDSNNFYNLDFYSLLEALKKSALDSGFDKQVYFIDACANDLQTNLIYNNGYIERGTRFSPNGTQGKNHEQTVLFASREYEIAVNETQAETGSFSNAVLGELNQLPNDCLLPDLNEFPKQVEARLKTEGKPKPIIFYLRDRYGKQRSESFGFREFNWREVCHSKFQEQVTINRRRRQATERAFELDIHVPLGLVERKQQPRRRQSKDFLPEKGMEAYQLTQEVIVKTYQHDEFLDEVIGGTHTKGKSIAIIGEPGAGKTTLSEKIGEYLVERDDLPIYIPASNLSETTLKDYLLKNWLKTPISESQLEELLHQQVWLLLDGVDEMACSSPIEFLSKQLAEFRQARVVLTCRLNIWDASTKNLPDFQTYKTQEFSLEQVQKFIQDWFQRASGEEAQADLKSAKLQQGQQLWEKLNESGKERLRDAVKNPLRLALLCQSWYVMQGELPETRAALYERFIRYHYEWKQAEFPTTLKKQDELKKALGKLALEALANTRFRIAQKFAYNVMGEELFNLACLLGLLNQVDRDRQTDEPFYVLYHTTFQEYFAALAIDNWHFFLNHVPDNPAQGVYCIFEPQWKEVILLWLGREDVPSEHKKQFIEALVEFDDGYGYWNFYEAQAFFLAAAGIAEFGDCSRADEIVQQIVELSFGSFDIEEQKLVIFSEPQLIKKAKALLLETERTKAINALEKAIETLKKLPQSQNEGIGVQMAEILEKLDPSKPKVIETLKKKPALDKLKVIELIRNLLRSQDEDTRLKAALELRKLAPGDPSATETLEELLQSKDEYVRVRAAWDLKKLAPADPSAIETQEKLLQSKDEHVRVRAAEILIKLAPDNLRAIETLEELLQSEDEYISLKALLNLEEIGSGNPRVIEALVKFLLHSQSIETFNALWSLKKILPKAQMPGVVTAMKDYLFNEADKNEYWPNGYYCCEILWHCAQTLPYPTFYQAWHHPQLPPYPEVP